MADLLRAISFQMTDTVVENGREIVGAHSYFFIMALDVNCSSRTFTEISEMRYETTSLISYSFGLNVFTVGIVYMSSEKMEREKRS